MATRRKLITAALGLMASLALAACGQRKGADSAAGAVNYPTQPVVLVVPFAPGGASDLIARLMQPKLSTLLGQQVVVENRDGGAGNVAMGYVARAKPDGYTLLIGNVGAIAINPSIFPDLAFNPAEAFVPISIVAEVPSLLIANPKFPANTVAELVTYAHANPGKVNFASPGTGSLNRLEMEVLRRDAKLDVVHVPYKGSATAPMTDVMGGHVDLLFLTASTAINHVKEGRLKALGVTSAQRSPSMANIPTLAEQGYPALVSSSWQGVFAPKGTPPAVLDKLHTAIGEVMKDPQVVQRLAETGGVARSSASLDEARDYVAAQTKIWGGLATQTGAKAD
jgi:tripartite-type tricarboxylate transporter receptor subunit TctC